MVHMNMISPDVKWVPVQLVQWLEMEMQRDNEAGVKWRNVWE